MLPSSQSILTILSIAAPVIAALSGIWGVAKELSKTNDDGDKRLTKAGKIAIALFASSATVGAVAAGFRASIDAETKHNGEKLAVQKDALAAQKDAAEKQYRLAEQSAREKERIDRENWKVMNKRQQDMLALIGMAETRRVGKQVISNDQILAAIEEQRDRGLAASSRLFQLAQSQKVILQSQPLRSLVVTLTFGGFTREEMLELTRRQHTYDSMAEGHDDFRGSYGVVEASNLYSIIPELVEGLLPGDDERASSGASYNRFLVLDLDGTGSWVIPLAMTSQKGRGFSMNSAWLDARATVTPNFVDWGLQDIGSCRFPDVQIDAARRLVTLYMNIPANCLATAVHRSADVTPTVHLSGKAALMVIRDGKEEFPLSGTDASKTDELTWETCRDETTHGNTMRYVIVQAVLNDNKSNSFRRRLGFVGPFTISKRANDPDMTESFYGVCGVFR